MILSPSMLSADFGHLAETLDALRDAGVSWVHWDVMDGRFVNAIWTNSARPEPICWWCMPRPPVTFSAPWPKSAVWA